MSVEEIKRFNTDLQADEKMLEEFSIVGNQLKEAVKFANERGYKFDVNDVKALTEDVDLADEEMDKAAGAGNLPGSGTGAATADAPAGVYRVAFIFP